MRINRKLIEAKLINFLFNICFNLKLAIFIKLLLEKYIVKGSSSKAVLYLSPQRSNYEIEFLLKNKITMFMPSNVIINEIVLFCIKEKKIDSLKELKINGDKKSFFLKILKELNLGLIISPAYHYIYDNLFAKIFRSADLKYLIFHREGYNFSKNHLNNLKKLIQKKKHKADKIIVHNKLYKNIFKEVLKSNKKKIEIVGPLRMQEILKFKKKINQKKSNKILFLSFTPAYAGGNPLKLGNLGQYGKLNKDNIKFIDQMKFNNLEDRHYNYEQFYFAHKIFFECVKNNPKYKFEIRLKFNNEYNKQIINNLCKKICGYHPLNLKLDQSNLWESINESYFVSGYGSTGLLEASMLNKPSVQIINKNLLKNPKINSNLRISNHLKCFNIVKNKKDLDLIFNKFVIKIKKEKSKKNEVLNRKAKLAFKNFIFDFKNKNNQKFLKIIFNLIN